MLKTITQIVKKSLTTIIRPLIKGWTRTKQEKLRACHKPLFSVHASGVLYAKTISQQCDDNCLLPDFQSAYQANYSIETCLIRMTNDILWAMEEQHITIMVILDLSAAFDMVDHNILLKILENQFGVTDTALKWFNSYLRPRSFKVCIGDAYSESQKLSFGVPQGSCSRANIFTCYCFLINKEVPELVSINSFADDHSLWKTFKAGDKEQETTTENY